MKAQFIYSVAALATFPIVVNAQVDAENTGAITIKKNETSWTKTSKRLAKGKYSFWVEDKNDTWNFLADIDEFNELNDVFVLIRILLLTLEITAEIPILTKDLRISDNLRKHVKKSDLGIFTNVLKED